MEERAKGNMVDFHICGEVNERTEKVPAHSPPFRTALSPLRNGA